MKMSVRITQRDGRSKDFPLEVYKSSIFHRSEWVPCGSFFVPDEAKTFMGTEHGPETIVYAFHEGQVTRDCIDDDDTYLNWELLVDGEPSTHEEFSTAMMNILTGRNHA